VHQPFFEIGKRAAELLLSLIESASTAQMAQNDAQHIQLATSLTVRESCGARAAHHFILPVPDIH
jgi:DNA-binding LacI/PurR family transcriptional regulator